MVARALLTLGLLAAAVNDLAGQEVIDPDVEEAEFLIQQPATQPEARPAPSRAARRASFREYASLDRVPNMYGDFLGQPFLVDIRAGRNFPLVSELPYGAARSFKISENNKPLPMDRIYFNYNGFQNALQTVEVAPGIPGPIRLADANVDRYTLGLEKTFFGGNASLDFRMPFVGGFNSTDNATYAITGENVGDMSLFYKQLLYADDMVAIAAGLGVGVPTGDDVRIQILNNSLTLNDEAVHLMPYFGALIVPNDFWFFQLFCEVDVAASGNDFTADQQNFTFGKITEQNFFEVSLSGGYWLHDNPDAYYLQGIAAIVEVHYATAINDADLLILGNDPTIGAIGNPFNRVDFLNLTSGLHFQIGPLSNLRVGCAVPLHTSGENRQFDSEIQVQFNRFF
jgi:hypothetical protein